MLNFPLGTHHGICILCFPNEMSVVEIHRIVELFLSRLTFKDYPGNLVIMSPGKLRLRRFVKKY